MPRTFAVVFAALYAASASAVSPTSVEQLSGIDRQKDDFYGAIARGPGVKVRWEVVPASVPLGTPVTLTLVVSNAVNPHELTRPTLLQLDGFRKLFSAVEDLPDEPNGSADVVFRYKVTPRNEGKITVPELKYCYFHPQAPPSAKMQTTRTPEASITVTKPAEEKVSKQPLDGPPEFFGLRDRRAFARSGGPDGWWWAGLFAAGAVAAAGWVVGWRLLFPDAARLAAIRRNRAVRTALDRLRKGHPTAEQVAVTVRNYLIARHGLAFTAQTPAEVAAGLIEVGLPPKRAAEAEGLLRECDAARFGGSADTPVSADRAAAMIERWEGVMEPGTQ